MAGTIEDTLRELNLWFDTIQGEPERPKLLSKLATLELCGWIELHMDGLIERTGQQCGLTSDWLQKNVIGPNHGLSYGDHLRPMLVRLIGEAGVNTVEVSLERTKPGMLDQLKADLGSLWKQRGLLAHTNIAAPVRQQITINAPSWSLNKQRIMAKTFAFFETELEKVLRIRFSPP
jgi:hypothetical protein